MRHRHARWSCGRLASMSKIGVVTSKADPEHLPARRASDAEASERAERRDVLLRFLADPPHHIVEVALALREAEQQYGDTNMELADLEAGRHPLQHQRTTQMTIDHG